MTLQNVGKIKCEADKNRLENVTCKHGLIFDLCQFTYQLLQERLATMKQNAD